MSKVATVDEYLSTHESPNRHYKQFTIDWIEEARGRIEDWRTRQPIKEPDFIHALHYDVSNVVAVMVPGLPDYQFFRQLGTMLDRLAGSLDAQTRQQKSAANARLN